MARAAIAQLLVLSLAVAVSGQDPTITALPTGPFNNPVNIATGSVGQLFCTADSSDVVFTWDRSGTVLTNDPPHIRIRSNSDASSTTSILTVDDFQAADSGVYRCSAGGANATTQMLTAFTPANPDNTLSIFRQPRDRESQTIDLDQPLDNRTALALGADTEADNTENGNRLLRCVASHGDDAGQPLGTLDWTINGRLLSTGDNGGRITVSPLVFATRYGADLMITAFEESDAGIYQCYATDDASSDSDVFLGLPFRLDTDIADGGNSSSVLRLERVSPEEILLTPPNKLVIEVKASGRYEEIIWSKDGLPFGDEGDLGVFVVDSPNELPNFAEIFVRGETTSTDTGTYTVALTAIDAGTQTIDPASLQFTVVATVAPITTADGPTMVTINETESVNISCTSTGLPTPGIQWTVGGVPTMFEQVDTVMEAVGNTTGSVTSVLQIVSAVPNDNGTYTCTGSNFVDDVLVGNSSDSIVVVVQVTNPVAPVASAMQPDPVALGAMIDLACVATNGTPPLTFTWTRDSDGMEVFSSATSGVYSFTVASDNTGSYSCNISNPEGSDATNVTVVLGVAPTVSSLLQNQVVRVVVGANLSLPVEITGFNQPLTAVTWSSGGVEVANNTVRVTIINSDLSIAPATSMLTVSPVVSLSADEGQYTVTAESPAGASSDVVFDVNVFAPPTITDPPVDLTVNESAIINVKCTASGFPAPSFVWLQGTTPLMNDSRITIVTSEFDTDTEGFRVVTSTLEISAANRSDEGSYACVASNNDPGVFNGEARDNFTITVNFIGDIIEDPVDTVVQAPDPLTLTCTASGVPQPDVTWTKTLRNGSTVLYTTSAENVNITNTYIGVNVTSTLTINPTNRNFTANYSCRASNFIGSTSESSQAQVIIAVRPTVLAPTEGEVFSVNQGGNLTVLCSASGVITPSIEFQQVPSGDAAGLLPRAAVGSLSAPMQTGDGDSMVSLSLTLSDAEDNDTRNLTCVASIFFSDLNVTFDDSVQFAVGVNIMVSITGPPMDRTVTSPAPAVFTCVATGFPRPEIVWRRRYTNGTEEELLDSDADVAISEAGLAARTVESTLTMLSTLPRDGFEYICNASNLVNSVVASAQLTVYDVPLIEFPMENFTYTVDELTSVTFECGASGVPGPTISWYRNANELTTEFDPRISFTPENETMIDTPRGPLIAIGRTLTFTRVFDNDSDIYTCQAVNEAVNGTAEQDFELIVRVAPEITVPPDNVTATQPGNATVTCSATGRPAPNITWFRLNENGSLDVELVTSDGSVITTEELGMRSVQSTLTLLGVSPSDAGSYSCLAENDFAGDGASAEFTVTVHVVPIITSPMDNFTLTVNETEVALFECTATGIPAPTISWYRNGMELGGDPRITLSDHTAPTLVQGDGGMVYSVSRTLMLADTTDDDSDAYTCRASNIVGNDTQDFELVVQIAPEITTAPANATVVQPDNVTFTCVATGLPQPVITWFFDDSEGSPMELVSGGDFSIDDMLSGEREAQSALTINFTAPMDAGVYVCVAENIVDTTEASAVLTVHVTPNITIPMDNFTLTVNETEVALFECTATGIPPPTISWYRNGIEFSGDPRITLSNHTAPSLVQGDGGMVYSVSRTLMLVDSGDDDSGTYTCVADNIVGNDSQEFELVVQIAPEITTSPTNMTVVQPNSVTFTCVATGLPRPAITWFFEGRPMEIVSGGDVFTNNTPSGEREVQSVLTIDFTAPMDAGLYVCVAENIVDTTEASAVLTVHVTPNITSPTDGFTLTVNETEVALFQCTATGIPPPTISWYRNDTELSGDSRITLSNHTAPTLVQGDGGMVYSVSRTLMLANTTDDDSDAYACRASNIVGNDTQDFELVVQIAPEITTFPTNTTVVQPDSVTFTCVATGRPRPVIAWFFEDSEGNRTAVESMESMVNISETLSGDRQIDSFLTLSMTAPMDAGLYVCMADNIVDTTEASAVLTVHVTPNITSPTDGFILTVNETEVALFECTATGIPPPIISWYRGVLELSGESRFTLSNHTAPTLVQGDGGMVYNVSRTLMLTDTEDDDSDNYTCRATNMVGSDSMVRMDEQDFELVIQVAPTILSLEPRALTVVQFEEAVFTCNATARPRPTITWFRVAADGNQTNVAELDRTEVKPTEIGERELSSELTISNAQPSDAGSYTCQADNVVSSVDESAVLTVHVVPIITIPMDNFILTVNETEVALFECTATGIPPPTISWYRNGTELSGDSRITLSNHTAPTPVQGDGGMVYSVSRTLMLADTIDDDSDTYTCVADNIVGNDSQEFELVVQIAPEITTRPENVTVIQPAIASFTCMATGRPRPVITWFFEDSEGNRTKVVAMDGVLTVPVPIGERVVQSILQFDSTAPNVAGLYVCVAENIVNSAEASAVLTVHVTPVVLFPEDDTFTYIANVTESVTFFCNATGIPPPSIQWLRSSMLLDGNATMGLNSRVVLSEPMQGLFTIEGEGDVFLVERTITVDPVALEDNGTFTCSAMNVADPDSQDFQLFVQVPPLVVAVVQTISTNESNNETLSFRVDNARPAVVIGDLAWYFSRNFEDSPFDSDAVDITGQSENAPESTLTFSSFTNNEISLTITNIVQGRSEGEATDAGRYFLVAVNPAGLNFNYTDLVVLGIPMIRAAPQGSVTIDGQDAVFICSALASPEHNIFWEFTPDEGNTTNIINTEDMSNSTKYSIGRSRSDTQLFGQLTVNNVQFEDRGTYRCTAENDLGDVNATASLTVHVRPVISRTSGSMSVRLEDMEEVSLVCLATGYPLPEITWQKDGQNIDLADLNAEGSGMDRVQILSFAVVNTTGGGMAPSVGGVDSGEVLALGELGIVSVLTFTRVLREDTANYTCNATNSLPETGVLSAVSAPISLTVLERPDSPENVTVSEFTARDVTLQWVPGFNGNSQVLNFSVYQQSPTFSNSSDFNLILTLDPSQLTVASGVYSFVIAETILPFRSYSFIVDACNAIGCSEQSAATEIVLTEQDRPDAAPMIVDSISPNSTSLYFSWSPPPAEQQNGIITGYQFRYYNDDLGTDDEVVENITETSITLTSLEIFTVYNVTVAAGTFVGFGPVDTVVLRTLNDTASPPLIVTATTLDGEAGQTGVTLVWQRPAMPNGIVSRYEILYTGSKSYDLAFSPQVTVNRSTGDLTFVSDITVSTIVGSLIPSTQYVFTVTAFNGAGRGMDSNTTEAETAAGPPVTPSDIPAPAPEVDDNPRTAAITLPDFDDTNGVISHFQLIIVFLPINVNVETLPNPDTRFPQTDLNLIAQETCQTPLQPYAYITAEFSADLFRALPENVFIVGSIDASSANSPNDRTNLYTNSLLCFSGRYTFFLRAFTASDSQNLQRRAVRQADGRQYDLFSSSDYGVMPLQIAGAPLNAGPVVGGIIAGIIVVVIIIVIVVVVVLYVKRSKKYVYKTDYHDGTENHPGFGESVKLTEYRPPDEGAINRQPIPVDALAPHIERMHLNENCGFGEEYRVINEHSPKNSVEACSSADNKPRNRYANIQCFDDTRVQLKPMAGAEHDYINGNYIDGYNREREYVATQGPLPDTVGDFWRLVWDMNSPTIVMLTNLVEKMKVKCTQYWPNTGSQQYANIMVTSVNSITHADFVVRTFQIKDVNSEETRNVRQYHFISWPDFGVPRHATPLLYFLRRIRTVHNFSTKSPMVIHCSAGVGRTGTLITIDVELQRAQHDGAIDPFNFVLQMRNARNHMVQTEAQYVFLHDAILEGISSGNTEVPVDLLAQRMKELDEVDAEGENGYSKEFSRLRQFRANVREFTDANDDANKFKNRLANALPYNYNRVLLQMSPGVGGSDYINASLVDGYAQKNTYIATQGPLANTLEDFWRMIWEKEVHAIVMLAMLEEKGKEQCARYWPDSVNSPDKIGSLTIELVEEKQFEDYLCRDIKVTDLTATTSNSRIVKQYHYTSWPESGSPSTGAGMIDLIDQVTRTQQHTGNKPIVVHCSAGIGRTGAFCALSVAIDRVKSEGIVDVFHTIKHLRTQRPHMVQTTEQYHFCYRAIREYVDSLSNYSNFQ